MNKLFLSVILICQFAVSQNKLTHEVYFETDKYDVPITEENRLLLFISSLSDVDIESISIYGFCDDRGSYSYNMNLSQNRANTIKQVFTNKEFKPSEIIAEIYSLESSC